MQDILVVHVEDEVQSLVRIEPVFLLCINLNNFSGRTETSLCNLIIQIEAGYKIYYADRRPVSCREVIGMLRVPPS